MKDAKESLFLLVGKQGSALDIGQMRFVVRAKKVSCGMIWVLS